MPNMPKTLARFRIANTTESYLLKFTAEDGTNFELSTDFDQLDRMADEIDRHLAADDDDDNASKLDQAEL